MIEEELKNIWKDSAKADQIKLDLSRLLIELVTTMKTVEQNIKKRDRREIAAALVGIPIFAYFTYEIPFLITKLACVFAICWFIYVIYRLKEIQKNRVPVDLNSSFATQLQKQKQYLTKQKNLIDNVLYWYVLPPFIMNVIFILGIGNPTEYQWESALIEFLPMTMEAKLRLVVFLAIFYAFVVWINKRGAKHNLMPIIDDINNIEKMQEEIESK